jgi:hypothetical protein
MDKCWCIKPIFVLPYSSHEGHGVGEGGGGVKSCITGALTDIMCQINIFLLSTIHFSLKKISNCVRKRMCALT